MAYETNSATSPDDLLDKLRVFLIAQGWTANLWQTDTFNFSTPSGIDGTGKRLHVQKTASDGTVMYFNFRSAIRGMVASDCDQQVTNGKYNGELTGIAMNGSTGYGTVAGSISSISNIGGSPNKVQIYCPGFYGKVGDSVVISGTSGGYYDGTYTIVAVSNPNYFQIEHSSNGTSTGTATYTPQWCFEPGHSGTSCVGIVELSTTAIPAYYFFADGDTVVVVVEYAVGKYQFLCFGCLEKQGAYTGGQFFTGSFTSINFYKEWYGPADTYASGDWYAPWFFVQNNVSSNANGAVYLNVDSDASWRLSDTTNKKIVFPGCMGSRANSYGLAGFANFFIKRAPNFYNAMAAMCHLYILGKRSDGNYSLLGWPKSIRTLNVSMYSAGQELTYGSETWKVFPATLEPEGVNIPVVKGIGFAIKKVV